MPIHRAIGILLSTTLCACAGVSTPSPEPPTGTPVIVTQLIVLTAQPEIVQVTRLATVVVEQEVVVTATPTPQPGQACYDTAMTQGALNSCALDDHERARSELDAVLLQLPLEDQDRVAFDQVQAAWLVQVQASCAFLYGRLVPDGQGSLYYERGSMAPMMVAMCETSQYRNRINELVLAYLKPDG